MSYVLNEQPLIPPAETPILSTEQVIASAKQDLKKDAISVVMKEVPAEFAGKTIAEIAESFDGAVVENINDQEAVKAMDEKRLAVWRIKNAINKKEKTLLGVAKRYTLEVKNYASELRTPFEQIEKKYKDRLQQIKYLKKQAKEAEERKRLQMIKERTDKLFEIGLTFNGEAYEIGGLKITPQRVEELDDVQWLNAVAKLQEEADQIAKEKTEAAEKDRLIEEMKAEIEALKAKSEPTAEPAPIAIEPPIKQTTEPEPVFQPEKKPEPSYYIETPVQPKPEPTAEPTASDIELSESEQHLKNLTANAPETAAKHFRGGFSKGLEFAKTKALEMIMDKSIKSRTELCEKIKAI